MYIPSNFLNSNPAASKLGTFCTIAPLTTVELSLNALLALSTLRTPAITVWFGMAASLSRIRRLYYIMIAFMKISFRMYIRMRIWAYDYQMYSIFHMKESISYVQFVTPKEHPKTYTHPVCPVAPATTTVGTSSAIAGFDVAVVSNVAIAAAVVVVDFVKKSLREEVAASSLS